MLKITARSIAVLSELPETIDNTFLDRYREFKAFRNSSSRPRIEKTPVGTAEKRRTPEETLEQAHQRIRNELAQGLLQKILSGSPACFEYLVVELLVKMGDGGS